MRNSGRVFSGRTLVDGAAEGILLVLEEPLSFWGGVDVATGGVIDRRHPQAGAVVSERVLVMPSGRGSSSSSTVLAEAVRLGTAPAAIVLGEPDAIVVLGALVARELYGRACPVVTLAPDDLALLCDGAAAAVSATTERATVAVEDHSAASGSQVGGRDA